MYKQWQIEELEAHFTLLPSELTWLEERSEPYNKLGQAVQLKLFQYAGRFPERARGTEDQVVEYIAHQLEISPEQIKQYDWQGRTARNHKRRIRDLTGYRPITAQDQINLADWLVDEVMPDEFRPTQLSEIVYRRLRQLHIEPPTRDRLATLVQNALHQYDLSVYEMTAANVSAELKTKLLTLIEKGDGLGEEESEPNFVLHDLKTGIGAAQVKNIKRVANRLAFLQGLGLPDDLFAGLPNRYLQHLAQQAAVESVSHLQRHTNDAQTITLLAAFCWVRRRRITDQLIALLIRVLNDIRLRAKKRVEQELLHDFIRVGGKQQLLYKLADAIYDNPDGIIRDVLYPLIGEHRLKQLVQEAQQTGTYHRSVQTRVSGSYTHHYRPILPTLVEVLEFRSNNQHHQPLIDALYLITAYMEEAAPFFPEDEEVPIEDVVQKQWQGWIFQKDRDGKRRIRRVRYELCVLQTLRDRLRSREIWVVGADQYRDPDEDVPSDFDKKRDIYVEALGLPLDGQAFIKTLQQQLTEALTQLNDTLKDNPDVEILAKGNGWIKLSPLKKQASPRQLRRLKQRVKRRWWMTTLLDIVKEVDLRVGFSDSFPSLTGQERLSPADKQKRLLLCLFALGTNTGVTSVSMGNHGVSQTSLQYVRRRFIAKEAIRKAIGEVVNATLAVRDPAIWGEATTWCASDSKQFAAWNQNLLTQWHRRYRQAGVMVYWHVAKQALCIHSQLQAPSSSEVAAMIEGVLRHQTDVKVERNFVDTHGQSEVGFAFCHLLGFQLMPRFKNIYAQKLTPATKGGHEQYPNLKHILEQPADWSLIEKQYDEMIKFATALRLGTAKAEAILKRFTRSNYQHPTYKALTELGRVVKTIFLCSYLMHRSVRREIQEGLNVVESWNSGNSFVFYGKRGEVATNDPDAQEIAVLSLHLLQACVVYINTLMVQQVLADENWQQRMTEADWRGLSPLFYTHINPYGSFDLDMESRLELTMTA